MSVMHPVGVADLEAHGDAMRRLAAAMLGDAGRARELVRDCQLSAFAALQAGAVSLRPDQLGPWLLDYAARSAARDLLRGGGPLPEAA